MNKKQLKDAIKSASFASLVYRSKSSGELARYRIQVGVNYLNMLEKSLLECRLLDLNDIDNPNGLPLRLAKAKVLKSLRKSILAHKRGGQSEDYTKRGVYSHDGKGITTHKKDESIEVHGYKHSKITLEKGMFKSVKSRPLTIAKSLIEKRLPKSKWRTFSFENVDQAKLAGLTLD